MRSREVKRFAQGRIELGPEASLTPGQCSSHYPILPLRAKLDLGVYDGSHTSLFCEGIQPLIENLETNTCENEINCKCSLQWKVRNNVCPVSLCHGHIIDPHNLLRDSTACGKHSLCSLICKASALQNT